jgi:hypothetical protein
LAKFKFKFNPGYVVVSPIAAALDVSVAALVTD